MSVAAEVLLRAYCRHQSVPPSTGLASDGETTDTVVTAAPEAVSCSAAFAAVAVQMAKTALVRMTAARRFFDT